MRWVMSAVAMLGFAHGAGAADLGYLRGSEAFAPQHETYYRWSGAYVGAQGGYANTQMDFTNAAASLISYILRESTLEAGGQISQWPILGRANARDVSYGMFIGYNSQWENAVLGFEANYNRTAISAQSVGSLSRAVSPGDGLIYHTTVDADASMKITDYGTLRGRAGWVMGRFMPYAMLGLALGRIETHRSATVTALVENPADGSSFLFGPVTQTENRPIYAIGYAAGAGVDVAILPNLFVRGEVEWVQFTNLPDMKAELVTGRVAAGLKF
jgi:opacity protein-like surface antigen